MRINNQNTEIIEALEDECQECVDCGSTLDNSDSEMYFNTDNEEICEDCNEGYFNCELCDDITHEDNVCWFHDNCYCDDCYQEIVTSCESCGDEMLTEDMVYDEYHGYSCEDCDDQQDSPEWNVYSNSFVKDNITFVNPEYDKYGKDTFDLIPSQRYMGVEIETNFRDYTSRQGLRRQLRRSIARTRAEQGLTTADLLLEEDTLGRLDVVSDGSVNRGDHEHGLEVVMQPRRGDILHQDVKTICDVLKNDNDSYVSRHCGLHLHIDCRDYDWYHFMVLSLFVKFIEPHIYTLVPQSRLTGGGGQKWCKPLSQSFRDFMYVGSREEFVDFWYDNGNFTNDKYNDKRYHGFNLHSHFQANQGIEIRYHGGTLNPDKIKHWSIFWSNVVDTSYEIAEKMFQEQEITESFRMSSMVTSLIEVSVSKKISKMVEKFNLSGGSVNIDEYMKQSEVLRRYLKLPKQDKPYLLQPMINHIRQRQNEAVMSIDNIFDTFNIPKETSDFLRGRMEEIMNNDYTTTDHIKRCFKNVSNVVEFNKETLEFKYTNCLSDQFILIDKSYLYSGHSSVGYSNNLADLIDRNRRDSQILREDYTM